ncbi:MAG: response regulator [Burkholderiales bacterium]|nr:response regulator [Burkholderiales bacterium]
MGRRILIAEDEPNIVTSLEFLMRKCEYEVCVARDGEEALEQIEAFRPHLVLLDVMLPRKSVFEVCRRVREDPRCEAIRIVMLSARGRDKEIAKGLALGADAYVTKPFSTRDLVAKVRELLPESV